MNFVFSKMDFPIYPIMILCSIFFASVFIICKLKKEKIPLNIILLSLLTVLFFVIIGAKIFTMVTNFDKDANILTAGLSSYGGAIGLIVSVLIFNKIYEKDSKYILKIYLMSLPLLYSISKLGCFFVGCCHGIKYNGLFNVLYIDQFNYKVFPIQLVESVLFFIIFIVCVFLEKKKSKSINYILLILCALAKFGLDFLRFSHVGKVLSTNQIVSIIFLLIAIILMIAQKVGKCQVKS